MISDDIIRKQILVSLEKTDFPSLGEKYQGKVRDNYSKDGKIVMITTDRISAFDHVLGTIPFKGQLLNQMTVFWFKKTSDIANNHVLDVPDASVMVVKKCRPYPVEIIVRGYITGSLWRDYLKGGRSMYGLNFEEGLHKDQKLAKPILTPSTKAEYGKHDLPISKEEIISHGLAPKDIYEQMEKTALALFKRGTEVAARQGLILVDTKYEFGDYHGELTLMDEIHTQDSSRYWFSKEYQELFSAGKEQHMLDKEFIRQWLIKRGFSGEGKHPALDDQLKIDAIKKYIEAFELITGQEFAPESGNVLERIRNNLKAKGYL